MIDYIIYNYDLKKAVYIDSAYYTKPIIAMHAMESLLDLINKWKNTNFIVLKYSSFHKSDYVDNTDEIIDEDLLDYYPYNQTAESDIKETTKFFKDNPQEFFM